MIEDRLNDSLIKANDLNSAIKPEYKDEPAINTGMTALPAYSQIYPGLNADLHIPEGIERLIEEALLKETNKDQEIAEEEKDTKYIKKAENAGMSNPKRKKSQIIFTEKIKFKKIIEDCEFTDRSHRLMATLESLSRINQVNIFKK